MPSLLEALERKYFSDCHFDNFNGDDEDSTLSTPTASVTSCGSIGANRKPISIFIPRMSPLKLVPQLLVLNDCDIDCAGDFETIKDKCRRVRELDLAQNKLQDWEEVFHILKHMPRIEFLNLSKNQLMGPISDLYVPSITNLRGIVLNGTYLDWHGIDVLLQNLPNLEEMHLSLNNYKEVLIDADVDSDEIMEPNDNIEESKNCSSDICYCDDSSSKDDDEDEENQQQNTHKTVGTQTTATTTTPKTSQQNKRCKKISAHNALKTLHFTGNPVESWPEICRLGRVFPNLQNLVLAECPIKTIYAANTTPSIANKKNTAKENTDATKESNESTSDEEAPYKHFPNLLLLNLSCANINTWEDIDQLAMFPKLRNLRVKNWPLWERLECTEHERRQLLIARLPNVSLLNGGGCISADEREDAERAFIRYYMDKPEWERPKRYDELIAKHGKLDPLVNITLKPDKRVKIALTFHDKTELRLVDVYRTVADFKLKLEKVYNLPANKMRLFYLDQDYKEFGPEIMKYPNKMLYSYNIQTGDEIIIDEKK